MNTFLRNKINIFIIILAHNPLKFLFFTKLINQFFLKSISLLIIKIILIFNNLFLSIVFEYWFLIELNIFFFFRNFNFIFIFFIWRLNTSLDFWFNFLICFSKDLRLLGLSFIVFSIWRELSITGQSFFHWHIWLVYRLTYIFFFFFGK